MKIGRILLIGALVVVVLSMISAILSAPPSIGKSVGIISITGPIVTSGSGGVFADSVASSTDIVQWIESADDAHDLILLEINSPGGGAVASDEIARAIERAETPVVAWIREAGASGAYWIASEADYIIAHRMSITGSVGVIASYIEWTGTLERYNATYRRFVAGDLKDTASPFGKLNEEQEEYYQAVLDDIHALFLDDVAENRNLTAAQKNVISDGRFVLGIEAVELNLVDELGDKQTVKEYIEATLEEEPHYVRYEDEPSVFKELFGVQLPRQGLTINT